MPSSRLRILGPLLAAVLVVSLSLLAAWVYFHGRSGGLAEYLQNGMKDPHAQAFARSLFLREVLPLYLAAGIAIWLGTLGIGSLVNRALFRIWGFNLAFGLTGAGLAWIHLVLWWQIPSALWVIPGLQHLPFWIGLPLLALLILVPLASWSRLRFGPRGWVMTLAWLTLWTFMAQLPSMLNGRIQKRPKGDRPVQALLIGIDGLRATEAEALGLASWSGSHYPHAYSMVPATRLFYSLIWGGDPAHYSIGHIIPAEAELNGELRYSLLEACKARGLKSRFYIDDGGTIGLTQRTESILDEVAMPAAGWENFINSNLAAHLPLYSSWLDVLRIFPSTTPWSRLDAGLRTALERGRGADLVMFHSCHLHQPIFLSRKELQDMPRWWTLRPLDLKPIAGLPLVRPADEQITDHRRDPLVAYTIRVRHLLAAWKVVWENLANDLDYGVASRLVFADHGERFYHATPSLRLQGTHGFDLDPWELRVPFLVAGPGFSNGQASDSAVSMLELRDALAGALLYRRPMSPKGFGSRPFAPVRYHTLNTDYLRSAPEGIKYLELDAQSIITGSKLLPGGAWVMRYQASLDERQKGVSLARANKDRLDVYKPLEGGGANHIVYEGFWLKSMNRVDASTFAKAKKDIEEEFLRPMLITDRP